jgi:hypothetical protein
MTLQQICDRYELTETEQMQVMAYLLVIRMLRMIG